MMTAMLIVLAVVVAAGICSERRGVPVRMRRPVVAIVAC